MRTCRRRGRETFGPLPGGVRDPRRTGENPGKPGRFAQVLCHAQGFIWEIRGKIKVIKCMAYGFRDDGYFFLKIKAAFPGIPG